MLSDNDYLRFGRQLLMPQWGEPGQGQLARQRVLLIGLGGLGCPALQYLAGAGVGQLRLVDADNVSLSNLPRQTLYRPDQVGELKVTAAAQWVAAHNPGLSVEAIAGMATAERLPALLEQVDVVLDCTDQLASRHAINAACVSRGVPLVSGAAIGWQGQLMVIDPVNTPASACFACLSDPNETATPDSCQQAGVAGPVVGAVGTLQALLALRLLLGQSVQPGLHRFDGLQFQWQRFELSPVAECPVCGDSRSL
ncbi:HesA/MoeB/ThiF family protein [Ferrimonas balearica]|uniref:HesA/MoeB/ThiF family protein n=1 Tax=Ferrimonas balearica TaxID=44012 RepID=UPI001C966E4A|nr:HesA/MoeB/ThiF family protein [Ferrimonas balearica]MBY6106204.1 HesA/MoeB/ThiF family protein [Ferrimonas balearica]